MICRSTRPPISVKRLVGIERVDDVVAIPPRMEKLGAAFVAVGVGVAGKVEPMAAPSRAVVRAVQEPVYQRLVGLRLAPAPEADRLTLARRLYFDLLDLPPSPEETRPFCSNFESTKTSMGLRG